MSASEPASTRAKAEATLEVILILFEGKQM